MISTQRNEKGQAIVILALAIVVLLGFTAIAIDGGMAYSDRRHAQNAADASSLAGAAMAALSLENNHVTYGAWDCNNFKLQNAVQSAETAAINRAANNTYTIDTDFSDHNGVEVVCEQGVFNGAWVDKYIEITTYISKTTDTHFAQFVFSGLLQNQVQAVTRVRPRVPLAFGNAVVSLNTAPCSGNSNGVIFSGSSDLHIKGGGVFSNGCLYGNGSNFDVNTNEWNVHYAGEALGTLININPSPQKAGFQLPPSSYQVEAPDCSSLPNRTQSGDDIYPGRYSSISLNNGILTMHPGLYCITGGPNAFKVNGGNLIANSVTIYITTGGVDISGNVNVNMSAPSYRPDPAPAIPNMLFFLAPGNTSNVNLQGNSDSAFLGTIYAPDGNINITGDSGTNPTFHTQVIGKNVKIDGNATIDINFNGGQNYQKPSSLELYK
jgi:Flp pilus assembly protein TadG